MEHSSGLLQFNLTPDLSLIFKFHFLWHIHLSLNNTTALNKHPRQTERKEKMRCQRHEHIYRITQCIKWPLFTFSKRENTVISTPAPPNPKTIKIQKGAKMLIKKMHSGITAGLSWNIKDEIREMFKELMFTPRVKDFPINEKPQASFVTETNT